MRPRDEDVREETSTAMAVEVFKWSHARNPESEDSEELQEIAECIQECLDFYRDYVDGYHLAKYLDDDLHIEPDDELVDILGDSDGIRRELLRKKISAWVRDNAITPAHTTGDSVVITHHSQTVKGEIISIDKEQATYTVFCEELGHSRGNASGVKGLIVPYEAIDTPEERTMATPLFSQTKSEGNDNQ